MDLLRFYYTQNPTPMEDEDLFDAYDRLANGNAPQHRPSLRSGILTAKKKKPSETLTERFRELAVIQFQ